MKPGGGKWGWLENTNVMISKYAILQLWVYNKEKSQGTNKDVIPDHAELLSPCVQLPVCGNSMCKFKILLLRNSGMYS